MTAPVSACPASLTAGERVRALREQAGWSQARLARAAGLSPGMISFTESGARNLTLPVLARVAAALATTVAALTGPPAGPASRMAAARVTGLRMERDWTAEALAGKAGIPPGTLVLMEASQLDFTVTALARVAAALEADPADLLQPARGRAR